MIDLEQEFQLLMRTVIKQINDKTASGELTQYEAGQLITMVNVRMRPLVTEDDGWSASTQACMESYAAEDDDGWSGSSRNC